MIKPWWYELIFLYNDDEVLKCSLSIEDLEDDTIAITTIFYATVIEIDHHTQTEKVKMLQMCIGYSAFSCLALRHDHRPLKH